MSPGYVVTDTRARRAQHSCELMVDHAQGAMAMLGEGMPINALEELLDAQECLADAILNAVRNARTEGHSWAVIGEALSVTRQAAAQRFG